jgi:hypothetical protein
MQGRMKIPELPFASWNDRMIEVERKLSQRYYWFAHRRLINEAILARTAHASAARLREFLPALAKARVAQVVMYLLR